MVLVLEGGQGQKEEEEGVGMGVGGMRGRLSGESDSVHRTH